MSSNYARRKFLQKIIAAGGGLVLAPLIFNSCNNKSRPKLSILDSSLTGHLLHQFQFPEPTSFLEIETLILGAGVSGLSAARYLNDQGKKDILILELESKPGGNAQSSAFDEYQYPLGAHYLPIINPEDSELFSFLEEHKIIIGKNLRGLPIYNAEYLCADPDERVFHNGLWQESLVPFSTMSNEEHEEISRFLNEMDYFRFKKGNDQKFAFHIPIEESSKDEEFLKLDTISFAEWLDSKNFTSKILRWYTNYCCRDDYGTTEKTCSAWAGIHYFAGRKGQGDGLNYDDVITWPEGNNFLVNCLLKSINPEKILTESLVYSITENVDDITVDYFDVKAQKSIRIRAKNLIDALPAFVHRKMKGNISETLAPFQQYFEYTPWVIANISVTNTPINERGAPLSWDNVIVDSKSLGYVNAGHQLLRSNPNPTVLTYYLPLTENSAKEERMKAHTKKEDDWYNEILSDLKKVHRNIEENINEVTFKIWGHAMISPKANYIWNHRIKVNNELNKFVRTTFAHTDYAGVSNFEEAFHQGIKAAQSVLKT